MDSVSQAALGAAIGEALLGKKLGNKGALLGAAVATIPDLDVLLLPFYSDLERISVHRGYSHSLVFLFIEVLLLTVIFTRTKWLKDISIKRLFLFNALALFTHVLLDTFTTYGTQLFLPFSDYRAGFDSINIVDPIYTLPLLLGLLLSLKIYKNSPNRSRYNQLGLLISSLYLLTTLAVKTHVTNQFKEELAAQKITYQSLLTVAVAWGSITWYAVAKTDTGLYIGKYSNLENNSVDFEYFPVNDFLLDGINPELADRMKWFAKGYYTVAKSEGKVRFYNMQCDMQGVRYLGETKAPTAFYFEIISHPDGSYDLNTGMHPKEDI
jgi:inner membrane protein